MDIIESKTGAESAVQIQNGAIGKDGSLRGALDRAILDCLGEIFQSEMAGIVRYMHYSFMVMGPNRIPIQKWFRDRAQEGMEHSEVIGEKITSLGGHPPVLISPVVERNLHGIDDLLKESVKFQQETLGLYLKLVKLAKHDIALEELSREFIRTETEDLDEFQKMLNRY